MNVVSNILVPMELPKLAETQKSCNLFLTSQRVAGVYSPLGAKSFVSFPPWIPLLHIYPGGKLLVIFIENTHS